MVSGSRDCEGVLSKATDAARNAKHFPRVIISQLSSEQDHSVSQQKLA